METLPGKAHRHVGTVLVRVPPAGVRQICREFPSETWERSNAGPAMSDLRPRQDSTSSGAVRLLGERAEGLLPPATPATAPRTAAATREARRFIRQHAALLTKTHTTARRPTAGSSAGLELPGVSWRPVLFVWMWLWGGLPAPTAFSSLP